MAAAPHHSASPAHAAMTRCSNGSSRLLSVWSFCRVSRSLCQPWPLSNQIYNIGTIGLPFRALYRFRSRGRDSSVDCCQPTWEQLLLVAGCLQVVGMATPYGNWHGSRSFSAPNGDRRAGPVAAGRCPHVLSEASSLMPQLQFYTSAIDPT